MKAIVNTGPNRLALLETPLPEPAAGQARIRTEACAICATDIKMIAGWERTGFPSIPGHEWAGIVDAVGEKTDASLVGKRCVAENVLSDGGEVGFEHPGGYGQYFLTEASRLLVLPDTFPMHIATLIEPLSVSIRALSHLKPDPEEPVLLFGDGAIGLSVLMLLARAGTRNIVVVGGREHRLRLASEIGATKTVNYHNHSGNIPSAIRRETRADFSAIVEASGSGGGMTASLEMVADCGRILVMGDYADARADFSWSDLMHRQIQLIGSCSGSGVWPEAVRLAVESKLPLDRLITHRFPAEKFNEAFALIRDREEDFIKIVLEW